MFYFIKEIINPEEVKEFSVPHNAELEPKMIALYNKYYDYAMSKYPPNKELLDEEFFHLSKGVFMAFLSSCLSEEESKNIDLYHLYMIKLSYTFCVARGFHVNNEFARYLDNIMTDMVSNKCIKEILNEFNNSLGPYDTPICDDYMRDIGFIGKLYHQDIRKKDKTIMIIDLKTFEYGNLDIINIFLIPNNMIEDNQKINLFYKKYVKWCQKWLHPTKPSDYEDNEDNEDEEDSEE